MNINIIAVGKLKEKYLKDGIAEFTKRLKPHAKIDIIEIPDESVPETLSDSEIEKAKDMEGEKILKKIKQGDYCITLEIQAKQLSSEKFAKKIQDLALTGNSTINFIIGGSNGLSKSVLEISDYSLSFSEMTFPHQLMRLILIEQIYRAFRIINNYPYHK